MQRWQVEYMIEARDEQIENLSNEVEDLNGQVAGAEAEVTRLRRALLEEIRVWAVKKADAVVCPVSGEMYPNGEMSIIHRIDALL